MGSVKKVFDPEIPVNIVDLGLVYSLEIEKENEESYAVAMQMTLTAPGCGMGPAIAEDAQQQLESVPESALPKWILCGIRLGIKR